MTQKHDYVNYDQFAQNFDMAYNAMQRTCLSTKFKAIWINEVGEFSIMLYGKNELVGFLLPINMAAAI